MFSIFTTRDGGYCDFDSITFFDTKLLTRQFRGELLISVKNDELISNILSDDGKCDMSDFLYGVSSVSRQLAREDAFSFTLDGIIWHRAKVVDGMLKISSESKYKTINRHTFVFILKIILSEINIFTNKANNKRYENILNAYDFSCILNY